MTTRTALPFRRQPMAKFPDIDEPLNVFIDTEVFDCLKHDYSHRELAIIASHVEHGYIKVVTTDVTCREIKSHINTLAREAIDKIRGAMNKNPFLGKSGLFPLDEIVSDAGLAKLRDAHEKLFDAWLEKVGAIVLDTSAFPVGPLLDDYFGRRAPFSSKKKAEFPDAIAATALEQWANDNDAKIHVVSRDGDWKAVCDERERLVHHESLPGFLQGLPDADTVAMLKTQLRDQWGALETAAKGVCFHLGVTAYEVDGYADEIRFVDFSEETLFVIDADDDHVEFLVEGTINVEVDLVYDEPGTGIWDSEDKVMRFVEQETQTIGLELPMKCIVIASRVDGEVYIDDIDIIEQPDDIDIPESDLFGYL